MLIDLHILIDTNGVEYVGVKEAVAVALERFGNVRVTDVKTHRVDGRKER